MKNVSAKDLEMKNLKIKFLDGEGQGLLQWWSIEVAHVATDKSIPLLYQETVNSKSGEHQRAPHGLSHPQAHPHIDRNPPIRATNILSPRYPLTVSPHDHPCSLLHLINQLWTPITLWMCARGNGRTLSLVIKLAAGHALTHKTVRPKVLKHFATAINRPRMLLRYISSDRLMYKCPLWVVLNIH